MHSIPLSLFGGLPIIPPSKALGSRSTLKRRGRWLGEGALPFEARAEPFATENGTRGVSWLAQHLKPPVLMRAVELFAAGHTVRRVALLLGLSRSEAGRLRQRAAASGLFGDGGEDESDTTAEGLLRVN